MAKKLGYIVTDYSGSEAGAIDVVGTTVTVHQNQAPVTTTPPPTWDLSVNGDAKVHSFFDSSNNLRVVVDQYEFASLSSPGLRVYNPTTTAWTPVTNSRNWAGIENLYGVVKQGSYLYAIDYDSANVVKIDIATYTVVSGGTYTFSSGGAPTYEDHGVALAAVDGYVYALFITSDSSASNYQNSTLVKLDVSGTAPIAVSTVAVGRNAQTLEYYDGKFYIACIGGMQHDGAANINIGQSRLDVVTISTMTRATPFTTNGTTIPGDFRDIVLSASGDAYILTGYYDNGFTTFDGVLHYTTAASINSGTPSLGTAVDTITASSDGYFWALLYEDVSGGTDYFWFVKGSPINIYQPAPTSSPATPFSTQAPSALGVTYNISVNWVTPFWEPSSPLARKGAPRSFATHARSAVQAKAAALELEAKK